MRNVIVLFFLFILFQSHAQNYSLTKTFTMADGLPSNNVYVVCEDNEGYLWIGTDNGVSRFDGKNFVNYSIADGLPSADAIIIVVDRNGTVWVNCYRQPPSYFDVEKNAFVCIDFNEKIRNISTELLFSELQHDGTIIFQNNLGYFQLSKRKIVEVKTDVGSNAKITLPNKNKRLKISVVNNSNYLDEGLILEVSYGNKRVVEIQTPYIGPAKWQLPENDLVYLHGINDMYCYYGFSERPFKYKRSDIVFPENIANFKATGTHLNVISRENTLFVCDKKTLKIIEQISIGMKTNSAFYDSEKRIWVATISDGLLFYSNSTIQKLVPQKLNQNYTSITRTLNNGMILGGHEGKVTQFINGRVQLFDLSNGRNDQSVFKNIEVGNNIFTITSDEYHLNFGKSKRLSDNGRSLAFKSAALINENTIAVGAIANLFSIDTRTAEMKKMIPSEKFEGRIVKIIPKDASSFYFIDNKGVFLFSIKDKVIQPILENSELTNGTASQLHLDEAKNLWIGTTKGYVYLLEPGMKNKASMKNSYVSDNILKLFAKNKRLWIGTKSGLFVINYSNKTKWEKYKFSEFDGLSSMVVNDFSYYNDTLYMATSKGVSFMPIHTEFKKFEIKPSLISVSVNDVVIGNKLSYRLKQDQNRVLIHLAGIDLTGHFERFEYKLNENENWSKLQGNFLNISLNNGENKIYIRAVDVNGKISSQKLLLSFYLETPFYKTAGFKVLLGIFASFFVILFFSRRKQRRLKINFDKQIALEVQRNKLTADLHDDIGATLSSLNINSAVANKLIAQNPQEAQKVVRKIELQSQSLADKIGDIIWSMKPGKDEFMSLGARIKNFASDILGATEIDFDIEIDPLVNQRVEDFAIRKNIVLITKEAINNAAKYSQAKYLKVKLSYEHEEIHLEIKDNGVGFDLNEIRGNGISNMKNRVEELHGKFHLVSNKNEGTILTAIIPCP